MKDSAFQDVWVSLAFIALLLLLVNPFGFWMPPVFLMMTITGFVVIFAIFASFVWRENHRDEREGFHKMLAGRASFLTGSALLVIGIIVQSLKHELDVWLPLALGGMILAKAVMLIYSRMKY